MTAVARVLTSCLRVSSRRCLSSISGAASRSELTSDTVRAPAAGDEVDFINLCETDFGAMSRAQQIRHLEVEGYVVLPEILPRDVCEALH